mgnify:CR=1 FL=1
MRLQALAFVVHFTGDIHMPLHSGDLDDRGGNDREAAYGIAPGLNLHWIWDGPLAERAITSARPSLVRRYTAAERAELAGGTPADWGRESWETARDFVYPNAFGRSPLDGPLPDGIKSPRDEASLWPFSSTSAAASASPASISTPPRCARSAAAV